MTAGQPLYYCELTIFHHLSFSGPVGDLSQTVKEVVCIVQTQNLTKTEETTCQFTCKTTHKN